MKIITLWQPWAWFIAMGWKTIETRTHDRFGSLLGQRIGIHAGMKWDDEWVSATYDYLSMENLIRTKNSIRVHGAIICTAFVEGYGKLYEKDSEQALIDCEYTTRYGLFLSDIKRMESIAVKGKQGIWEYNV